MAAETKRGAGKMVFKKGQKGKKAPAHEVLLTEIQSDVSSLSDLAKSKEDRQVSIKSIETKCSVLGRMDLPPDARSGVESDIKGLLGTMKLEIDSKTAASNVISGCLKEIQSG